MPVALAALLSFILAPLVQWLQRAGLNRVVSVLVAAVLALSVLSGLTYVVGSQFYSLVQDLPRYEENLRAKIRPLRRPLGDGLDETARTVKELADELKPPEQTARGQARIPKVEVVPPPPSVMDQLRSVFGPVLAPLSTAGIVLVFLVFMLLERDTLRERVIRMSGADINRTTRALAEATQRVIRYLAMQTLINSAEGALLTVGLYAIGVPNAMLWGTLLLVLRFVPYLGVWVAAAFPVALAVAAFDDWRHVAMTIGLIVALESVTSQLIEPLVYGRQTGVSPLALLVAAVFWTWLWGPAGLFLAIPLTVTLVVIAKYLPQFAFMGIMMGDQPVLEPWERYYQRLLARAPEEADEVLEESMQNGTPREAAERVLIPTLAMTERDHYRGMLNDAQRLYMLAHADAALEELFHVSHVSRAPAGPAVLCVPVQGQADEISAAMLARVLAGSGIAARVLPSTLSREALLERVAHEAPSCVFLCAFPPSGIAAARRLCRRIGEANPGLPIDVVLWDLPEVPERVTRQFIESGARGVFTRLSEAAAQARPATQAAKAVQPVE